MKPAPFVYHKPHTVDEAAAVLAQVAPDYGRVLAGGQSLVPSMAFRLARPTHLIDINNIAGLDRLAVDGDALSIGATVRHASFHRPVTEGPLGQLLAFVVQHIAHYPIRTRGTFCGSLANADPASEWCMVAATLDATIKAKNRQNTRDIPAEDYFDGIMSTTLKEDEILVEARLPILAADTRFGFYEFSRRAGDLALAMALVLYRIRDGKIVEPRIGIGGVEARPRRLREAETVLAGREPTAACFRAAAEAVADAIEPLEDTQTNAACRRDLIHTAVSRALKRTST